MSSSRYPTLPLALGALLIALTSLFPVLLAQPPPPPPAFHQPDALFHGYDIRSFALDPSAPYLLINDAGTFVHALDLMHGGREEMLFVDETESISWIGLNRRGNPLLVQDISWQARQRLVLFDDRWRPTTSIDLSQLTTYTGVRWNTQKLLIDTNDYVYIMGYNRTGTYFVTILDRDGVQRDSWVLGTFPTLMGRFIWAMDFANNVYFQQTSGATTTRPLRIFTSGGVLTDTLNTNLTAVDYISHISVSPRGNIFLTAGYSTVTMLVFDANYRPMGRYSLDSVAYSIQQVTFDSYDNLWVLDEAGEAVLALAPNGDLRGSISSPVPSLYNVNSLQYDRQTQTLLVAGYYIQPSRIDTRDGSLMQTYSLPDRLSSCSVSALQVTGDGNIWMLLMCWNGRPSVIHVVNRAGKIQKEFPAPTPAVGSYPLDLVLDPMEDRMFVALEVGSFPTFTQTVQVATLEGVPLFNLSFASLSPPITSIAAMYASGGVLHVTEYGQTRLTMWDIYNGSLIASVDLGINRITAVVADRDTVFVSRFSQWAGSSGSGYNSSVLRFDKNGQSQEQYGMGPTNAEGVFSRLALSDDGSRLYGYNQYYGTVAVWRVGGRQSDEGKLKAGEVLYIEPMMVMKAGKEGEKEKVKSFLPTKGGQLPASMFVPLEAQ